jgi:hypothetical protein
MPVDQSLPTQEFIDCQLVAFAGLFEAQQATSDGRHNLGLSSDDPAFGIWGRKVRDGKGAAIGTEHVAQARSKHFGHSTLTHDQDHARTVLLRV